MVRVAEPANPGPAEKALPNRSPPVLVSENSVVAANDDVPMKKVQTKTYSAFTVRLLDYV